MMMMMLVVLVVVVVPSIMPVLGVEQVVVNRELFVLSRSAAGVTATPSYHASDG